jgi:arylsulfatase A
MTIRVAVSIAVCLLVPGSGAHARSEAPNIVIILADDMGIDSVAALNEKCGVETPNLDRLVAQGLTFTDAHSSSAVCSPTRYGVLTGRYSWRTRLKQGIVGKWQPPLIADERLTLPEMLRDRGYATACVGKWHLGWNWPKRGGGFTTKPAEIDYRAPIQGGPLSHGFDYYLGDDVPNWPPFVWIENDRALAEPTAAMKAGAMEGVSAGPATPGWQFDAVLPRLTAKCVEYIEAQAKTDEPFFLFFPMTSPHTPIAPSVEFRGKSRISVYADFLMETDWAVGQLLRALEQSGQADRTLVVFTGDNGTSPKCDFENLEQHEAHLREHWRGWKADAFEGGHRVPFVVRWPGVVAPGGRCAEVISLVDLMATVADVVDCKLPADAAEDSRSLLPYFRGQRPAEPLHEAVICHSASGRFVVRRGKWKLLFCRGSGGWSPPRENEANKLGLPPIQLYDLTVDPRERTNVYADHPDVVRDLTAILRRFVERGRSTPGPAQTNTGGTSWPGLPWHGTAGKR